MTAYEVLTTTRAVRRRMDFDRPVDRSIVLDCIDIARQAPMGGNVERMRWVVVEAPGVRAALAELYREIALPSFERERDSADSADTRRVYGAAAHLAENLHRVPVHVIPCSLGTPPTTPWGAAGFFGSVLPAVWSFQLALRARGLGSAYTSAILSGSAALADILGLPADVTPGALLPIGHTIGTDFHAARRGPVEDVTFIDRWGAPPRAHVSASSD